MQREDTDNKENEGSKEVEIYYDSISEGYNELHEQEQLKKLGIIEEEFPFNLSGPIRILDVGCGTGISSRITDMFLNKGIKFDIVGIDPSEKLLEKNKFKSLKAYAENIPFEDNSFDLVISLTAAQNFSNMEKAISEIARVGKYAFVLTILANSNRREEFEKEIQKKLKIVKKAEGKDLIVFATKQEF